jgi:hypothetical protein
MSDWTIAQAEAPVRLLASPSGDQTPRSAGSIALRSELMEIAMTMDRTVGFDPRNRGWARATTATELDVGLRRHLLGIYNYMLAGLVLSGAVALFLANSGLNSLFYASSGQLTAAGWTAVFSPLAILLLASFTASRLSTAATHAVYWSVTALLGVSLGLAFEAYTGESIARVFFITAAAFGALSLWGYTTKQSLTGWGSFLFIGLVGVVIASIVNLFVMSSLLHFVVAGVGVVVFAGLTAYDTQRLKLEYASGAFDTASAERVRIWGALALYLNFLNLFQLLLTFLGQRDE